MGRWPGLRNVAPSGRRVATRRSGAAISEPLANPTATSVGSAHGDRPFGPEIRDAEGRRIDFENRSRIGPPRRLDRRTETAPPGRRFPTRRGGAAISETARESNRHVAWIGARRPPLRAEDSRRGGAAQRFRKPLANRTATLLGSAHRDRPFGPKIPDTAARRIDFENRSQIGPPRWSERSTETAPSGGRFATRRRGASISETARESNRHGGWYGEGESASSRMNQPDNFSDPRR